MTAAKPAATHKDEDEPGHAAVIVAYFDSCNTGDPERIAAHFTSDAIIYDSNHPPIRSATEIGRFWQRIHSQWAGARWQVDRVVSDGETAAIEWQMAGTNQGAPFIFRGSEHYGFDGALITEIRQYWSFDREAMQTGLVDYPYGETADALPGSGADS